MTDWTAERVADHEHAAGTNDRENGLEPQSDAYWYRLGYHGNVGGV